MRRNPYLIGGIVIAGLLLSRSAHAAGSLAWRFPVSWSTGQRANAEIIDRVFRAVVPGCTDELVMAAIANAYRESGLRASAKGDGASGSYHSFGLFQCNVNGAGSGYTPAELLDPETNATIIASACAGSSGKSLRAAMADGATAQDLAEFFTRKIERPAKPDTESAKSRQYVLDFFGDL